MPSSPVLKRSRLLAAVVLITCFFQLTSGQVEPNSNTDKPAIPSMKQTEAGKKESSIPTSGPTACDQLTTEAHLQSTGSHSVVLSWNRSVPLSDSPRDAIVGYNVYRSAQPRDPKAPTINRSHIADTTCVDTHVVAGEVYYYAARAVNTAGVISDPSNEVRVQVPLDSSTK